MRVAGIHEVSIEGNTELQAVADRDRINQVVINLVNNTVKYALGSNSINLKTEQSEYNAKVSVQDFGPGISQDKLPHLFDHYYRVHESGIQLSGLGLGLYISKEIIERHGRQIGVESEVGKGSTFWFTLPLK